MVIWAFLELKKRNNKILNSQGEPENKVANAAEGAKEVHYEAEYRAAVSYL